jgi:hypothetical protein
LENAKECFETQQTELRTLMENAKKNCSVENMMESARQTVEIQQAEFNSLIGVFSLKQFLIIYLFLSFFISDSLVCFPVMLVFIF